MATAVQEDRPPEMDPTSDPPSVFDGTTRIKNNSKRTSFLGHLYSESYPRFMLYMSYWCPFAQRVWITRNCKGLQDKIKLVPIDLRNRPVWYKEKVHPQNKVPALEHDNKVIAESLDLIKYVDSHFEGPSLFPEDLAKREFAEELLAYTDKLVPAMFGAFKSGDAVKEAGNAFDYIENSLHKFDNGPFFLGQFSLVDIAFAPFIERFQLVLSNIWEYDITAGRPKLAAWIEELNKIEAYKQTRADPDALVAQMKKFLGIE